MWGGGSYLSTLESTSFCEEAAEYHPFIYQPWSTGLESMLSLGACFFFTTLYDEGGGRSPNTPLLTNYPLPL